jgi:hypothetical protein
MGPPLKASAAITFGASFAADYEETICSPSAPFYVQRLVVALSNLQRIAGDIMNCMYFTAREVYAFGLA